jgi:Cu/Ag efflux pump CusA
MKSTNKIILVLLFMGIISLTNCKKNTTTDLAPFQPEIANIADNFQLQATNVVNATATLEYTWTTSGTKASIDKACTITSGTAYVTIYDANGTQVYTSDMKLAGSQLSIVGTTGNWKIKVVLSGVNGTLSLRVQKGG